MDIPSLENLITGLASGVLTYPVAGLLFSYLAANTSLPSLSPNLKRWVALALSFALAAVGLVGGHYLYDMPLTWQTIVEAGTAAFAASQMLHSTIEMREDSDKNRSA